MNAKNLGIWNHCITRTNVKVDWELQSMNSILPYVVAPNANEDEAAEIPGNGINIWKRRPYVWIRKELLKRGRWN
jgi:hypothetical protein